MDTIIVFGKGLAGGALAGGLDWGVSKAPIGGLGQGAIMLGAGLVTSLALARWVDPVVGAGMAGGTSLVLINRSRRWMALRDLGKSTKNSKTNEAGAVLRVKRDAGKVMEVRRREAGMGTFPQAQTMPVPALAVPSFKTDQESGDVYVPNGRRYGPMGQNWIGRVIEASRHTYQDESGRVIRVRGAYN